MSYTLGQAAKATGKSKATIHRAVQSGKLSAVKDEASGTFRIDPAELHRIFPAVSSEHARNGDLRQNETTAETDILRAQLEQERQERQRERVQLEGTIDDLRKRLDREGEERRKLTAILTDQRAQAIITPPPEPAAAQTAAAPVKRRWWQRG
jgi:excisionase family DNA binding protein